MNPKTLIAFSFPCLLLAVTVQPASVETMHDMAVAGPQSAVRSGCNGRPAQSFSQLSTLSDPRFRALSQIESGDNDYLIGRAHEVSRYQVTPTVWRKYCSLDPVIAGANSFTALNVAAAVMQHRCQAFATRFHRAPDDFEFYVLWNSPATYLAHHRLAPDTADKAARFSNLVQRFSNLSRPARWPGGAPASVPFRVGSGDGLAHSVGTDPKVAGCALLSGSPGTVHVLTGHSFSKI